MNTRNIITILTLVSLTLVLSSCKTTHNPTEQAPGFLPDYSLLKPVPKAPKGTEIYTYQAPDVKPGDYHSVVISPVSLYQTATKKGGVTEQQIEAARTNLQTGIAEIVSKKMPVVNAAGPGVARLDVAITGAMVENDSLKPRNLIPVSAAITIVSRATGINKKKTVLIVELKFTDSISGKLLRETVSVINGENFRLKSNTTEEFTALAQNWVQQALKYSEVHK